MKRVLLAIAASAALAFTAGAASEGYRIIESAAASVNGEVIFLSEVARESCFYRCGAVPGQPAQDLSLLRARDRLISDTLVLQEQKKLGIGEVDNATLATAATETLSRVRNCSAPCAATVTEAEVRDLMRRKMLVRDFLERRVAVFIEINDEEVRKEIDQRSRAGARPEDLAEDAVRKRLYEEKAAVEVRNWFTRTTSKSRIVLSPLSEP